VVHSSQHKSGAEWRGRRALVVGSATSGHDLSVDFANNGVDVTMLQRSPTFVMSIDDGMKMTVGRLFSEDTQDLDLADRMLEALPRSYGKLVHQRIIPDLMKADAAMISGLERGGFRWYPGPDASGFLLLGFERGGGYYFNSGGSDMIAQGRIRVKQGSIASFEADSKVAFTDGTLEQFDIVVFATGYTGFPEIVSQTVGEQYAKIVSPVWGLDEEGEVKGVARETNIPNLYFIFANFAQSRLMSKSVALQIIAQRLGRFGERYSRARQLADGDLDDETEFKCALDESRNCSTST